MTFMVRRSQAPEISLARKMQVRRPISAWLMSVLMHAGLVILLTVTWKLTPKNALVESDRQVGIVLVHQQAGEREYTDPNAEDTAEEDTSAAWQATSEALPSPNEVPVELSEVLPGAASVTAGGMAESILDATKLTGEGTRRAGVTDSNGTSTEVFGLTGVGTKFVYVFDRSGSMANFNGRPLLAAKMELIESLNDLDSVHQFQIIFYNERPKIFEREPGKAELVWGDTEGKTLAREFVSQITATGGTEHLAAIKLALGMRPDVVFFLTDADEPQLTFNELQRIQRWNRGSVIHAIEFGAGPKFARTNFLMNLAQQNGGKHAYVDVRRLREKP